ncbi:hypothetical protein MasN3_37000 [Massilia varians]|uniref:Secreted protein n=1 Tax=Massilia varians TaxID=457921 RepID=A0ABN6TIX1_9BURK|nr:hypothetical protein MasN3_37000 [Massilia varians]
MLTGTLLDVFVSMYRALFCGREPNCSLCEWVIAPLVARCQTTNQLDASINIRYDWAPSVHSSQLLS